MTWKPNLTTVMNELDALRKELEDGEPQCWQPEKPGSDRGEYVNLPEKPTIEQLRSAVEYARYDLIHVLEKLSEALETVEDNRQGIAALKNHRHDPNKIVSGPPEM